MVVDRCGDLTVYKVCPEFQTGPIRILHRDLLLPCRTLSSDVSELKSQSSVPKRKTCSKAVGENPEEDSPDSEEVVYYSRPQYEVVSESFIDHTSKATQPVKKDIAQSLETGLVSKMPELQVTENLPC